MGNETSLDDWEDETPNPRKHEKDQFYTNPPLARALTKLINLDAYDLIIEPSAGDGAFSDLLSNYNFLAFDIDPKKPYMKRLDFLEYNHQGNGKKILCIGNPPYGRQCVLALAFIEKCAEFAHTIAFILPKSFKKDSIQSRVPQNFLLTKEIDIELLESEECKIHFLINGHPYLVPSVFQIWKRITGNIGESKKKEKAVGFLYVAKENAHLAIQRVGSKAGKASTNVKEKAVPSHYFIRLEREEQIESLMWYLCSYKKWPQNNTTGPKSLSKSEINKVINTYLQSFGDQDEKRFL
jgi:hypothetical protein